MTAAAHRPAHAGYPNGVGARDLELERELLRAALVPFAFIGRGVMLELGLCEEYDDARRLIGLEELERQARANLAALDRERFPARLEWPDEDPIARTLEGLEAMRLDYGDGGPR